MMPLNHILRKYTAGSKFSKSLEKFRFQMYKNEKESEIQILAMRIYSQDVVFGIEKCAIQIMKIWK